LSGEVIITFCCVGVSNPSLPAAMPDTKKQKQKKGRCAKTECLVKRNGTTPQARSCPHIVVPASLAKTERGAGAAGVNYAIARTSKQVNPRGTCTWGRNADSAKNEGLRYQQTNKNKSFSTNNE
jgi:hypothetical protein